MNGLEIAVADAEELKETGERSVASARLTEGEPMLSDSFGVVGRDLAFLLPLGGGGNPTGKVES
jgi:hypothetical protein